MPDKTKSEDIKAVKRPFLRGESLIRLILDATSDFAVLIDLDGMVLAVNALMATRIGASPKELLGTCFYDRFPPNAGEKRRAIVDVVVRGKTPFRYEDSTFSGRTLDTRVLPVLDSNGDVSEIVVLAQDITHQKKGEAERLRLATAIEQAGEAFIIWNDQFEVEYVNQAFEDMTGYSQSEVKGRSMTVFYSGQRQKTAYAETVEVATQGEIWTGRSEITRKNGRTFQCDNTVSPIRGKGGVILGYVSVWRDVTRLEELEKELRQAQKMEALGTLAGGIAHDFNNVLGPIILHSELGLDMLEADNPARKSFNEILVAADRARSLIGQILHLARRREEDEPIPFKLGSIIKECLKLLRPSLPSTIKIVTDIRTDDDFVLADPTQLHQVVMNLCTNASHAMGNTGGLLTIRLTDDEGGRYVQLVVEDTGQGMSQDLMEKIFEPFFTTKKDGTGSGLGLTVVQSIVSQAGGGVKVKSRPGKGSSFRIMLPKVQRPVPIESCLLNRDFSARRGERIMVVDDEAIVLAAVRSSLERLGYSVRVCSDPFEALIDFRNDPDCCDLVLSDVTMPGMTGIDLAREFLAIRPGLPVVLSSGYTELVGPGEAKRLGVAGFLKKPFSMTTMAETIRQVLDNQENNNQSREDS